MNKLTAMGVEIWKDRQNVAQPLRDDICIQAFFDGSNSIKYCFAYKKEVNPNGCLLDLVNNVALGLNCRLVEMDLDAINHCQKLVLFDLDSEDYQCTNTVSMNFCITHLLSNPESKRALWMSICS